MEILSLLLLGVVVGVVVGWVLRARLTPPQATGEPPELLAARHEAAVAEVRRQEAAARAEVQAYVVGRHRQQRLPVDRLVPGQAPPPRHGNRP